MNVGEYGTLIYLNVGEDISAASNQILFCDPDGEELTKTATVGSVNYTSDDGIVFTADEYATYTFQDGDIDQDGIWKARLHSTTSGVLRKTDWIPFKVLP